MKRYGIAFILLLCLALLALTIATPTSLADNGPLALLNTFDLSWWTVDGGGATAVSGGDYTLGGTIGQADTAVLSGGGYSLAGGFWNGVSETERAIYLPLILR